MTNMNPSQVDAVPPVKLEAEIVLKAEAFVRRAEPGRTVVHLRASMTAEPCGV